MSKKNRVIATVTVHLTEDGTYKIGVSHGENRKNAHGLNWSQVQIALNEIRAPKLVIDNKLWEPGPQFPEAQEVARILASLLPPSIYDKKDPPADSAPVQPRPNGSIPPQHGQFAQQVWCAAAPRQPIILRGFWLQEGRSNG